MCGQNIFELELSHHFRKNYVCQAIGGLSNSNKNTFDIFTASSFDCDEFAGVIHFCERQL